MKTQTCPNCQRVHDVTVYVTGQKLLCACGIRFEVRRTDVNASRIGPAASASQIGNAAVRVEPEEARDEDPGLALTLRPVSTPRNELDVGVPAPHTDAVGRTFVSTAPVEIPGFVLGELLGRGGMGEVWRAHQQSLGRTVAVKLLPPELAKDEEFVTRFEKEATALAALNHPHITQIIDRGVAGAHYYFVMEFVEGRSLRELMTGGRPSPAEALRIIVQILRAIEAAHDKHIIHRDLKPENILVDGRGHVKVADFGLAGMRGVDERLQLTATRVTMGTLNYMAPEQRRDARNVDERADLYALGVILYELLTGELPIGRFRLPSERVPGLDPRLDGVIEKLLQPEPADRFAKASDVLAVIEPLISGSGVSSAPVLLPGSSGSVAVASTTKTQSGIVDTGRKALKNGLLVIGALAAIGFAARMLLPESAVTIQGAGKEFVISPDGISTRSQKKKAVYPPNTYGEVFSDVVEEELPEDRLRLKLNFGVGDEEVNVHSGQWRMVEGRLEASQAGNETGGNRLIPRAYVAHRYFRTDDYEASVNVTMRDLSGEYEIGEDVQKFAEVAMRIKNLQVSAFAIPGVGMRMGWRYRTPEGNEVSGNSAQDLELMVEDETPAPPDGTTFRLGLRLRRVKAGIEAEALLNGRVFARKVLPGLQEQVGKITVGCRNYQCAFDDLEVEGTPDERPAPAPVTPPAAE